MDFSESCKRLGFDLNMSGWPDKFGQIIKSSVTRYDQSTQPISVLSLFTGAGGLDIGFRDAGFNILESVEIEKKFCKTLEANSAPGKYLEGAKVNCIDIREYQPDIHNVDFIIGGPPCQTFSAAGRRANGVLGTSDERGVLFREYARLLRELRPTGFLFENVYGIIGAQGGKPWEEIKDYFSNAGYKLFYRILDAADYGAPQHRERLIIVGLKTGNYYFPRPIMGPDSDHQIPFYNAATAIASAPVSEKDVPPVIGGKYGYLIPGIPPGLNYSFYTEKMGNPQAVFAWRSKFSDFMYKADPEMPVRTVKAQGGQYTGPIHWNNRHFSVSELKRLQTIPDQYLICGSRQVQIQQIGNSVPPQLARILALSIRSQIFNRKIPIQLRDMDDTEILGFRKRKRELTKRYQDKAKKALSESKKINYENVRKERFFACLTEDFSFQKANETKSNYAIELKPGKRVLRIDVTGLQKSNGIIVLLIIKPANKWALNFDSVIVKAKGHDSRVVTAAWKAAEYFFNKAIGKADLVQLSGYYQYHSSIICEMKSSGLAHGANILETITNGSATRKLLSASGLCTLLNLDIKNIAAVALWLRSLGYEIRNKNTNSQIPEGYWLIPYEFPTLTPLSVQLRKKI